jgi:hypothetical protein
MCCYVLLMSMCTGAWTPPELVVILVLLMCCYVLLMRMSTGDRLELVA